MQEQIQQFAAGTYSEPCPQRRKGNANTNEDRLNVRLICDKLNEGDVKGAVRLVSSHANSIAPSKESCSILQDKHPSRPED